MSKYTTEVRYICENYAGLTSSVDGGKIGDVIEKSREKVFDFDFPIYDESYRSVLESKILKRYYTREIGFETVGLWKHFLDMRLNEIMPFYNQMYKSALLEFNPFYDVDITTDSKRGIQHDETSTKDSNVTSKDSSETNTSENDSRNSSYNNSSNGKRTDNLGHTNNTTVTSQNSGESTSTDQVTDKYSDTPQNGLSDIVAGTYLTNARITNDLNNVSRSDSGSTTTKGVTSDTGNVTTEGSENGSAQSSDAKTGNENRSATGNTVTDEDGTRKFTNTDEYLEHVRGKRGGASYASLLQEYRKTFLNIDVMIIDELGDLFMNVW